MQLLRTRKRWTEFAPGLPAGASPIGYAWMVRELRLSVMPPARWSFAAPVSSGRLSVDFDGITWVASPLRSPPTSPVKHLEYAIKHEGINLEILHAYFLANPASGQDIERWLSERPNSAHGRRAWFVYETATSRRLELPDASTGPYVPLLDELEVFVGPTRRSQRHRVDVNLIGGPNSSVMLRRTPFLESCLAGDWATRARQALEEADPTQLLRAVTWLYTKETRSSYEIEREVPSADRVQRFVTTLKAAQSLPILDKTAFIHLQNQIVTDPRNHDTDWRDTQNYVSRGASPPDYISPTPEALPGLMEGWLSMLDSLLAPGLDPVLAAAAAAFSFVYLHPFEDGNGRIHRFLIHYVLAKRGFTPDGAILPVSAVILGEPKAYDDALEHFSVPLMDRLSYDIDAMGVMLVKGDTAPLYRHLDLTVQAEALFRWIIRTIEVEVPRELRFVSAFQAARTAVAAELELPDRILQPLIARTMEQGGRLSKTKRDGAFKRLTEAELDRAEALIRQAMLDASLAVESA